MASFVFCDGQQNVTNLDNTDFIRLRNVAGAYEIQFYKSQRTSKEDKAYFICAWTFRDKNERDEVMEKLIKDHGSKIELEK